MGSNSLTKVDRTTTTAGIAEARAKEARRIFFAALQRMRLSDVILLLTRDNNIEPFIRAMTLATEELALVGVEGFREAALRTGTIFPELIFDDGSPGVQFAHRLARDRIRNELVGSITDFLQAANEIAGRSALTQARHADLIRSSLGLNGRGIRAANRFRDELIANSRDTLQRQLGESLDDAVRRALDTGRPLTLRQIDDFTERYRRQLIARRVDLVARLHAQRTVGAGLQEFLRQVFETTDIDPNSITLRWFNTPVNIRESHQAMDGQRQPPFSPFLSGLGNQLRYPGDETAPLEDTINCKCFIEIQRS